MNRQTPISIEPSYSLQKARAESLLLVGIVIIIGWFYLWTARPEFAPAPFSRFSPGYYNLLTQGFLKGQLSLDTPADPFLATLQNPWNPEMRRGHGLHDASYYHGKYYIYFGVTPVLVLFLPIRLLSGLEIDQAFASVVFAWVGIGASAWLVAAIRRDHFPTAPSWMSAVAVAAVGMANTMPILLRRASIWEVPITCAYACFMVGLCFLYGAIHGKRRNLWLIFASVSFGLAVGARPTYLLCCAALLVPLFHWMRSDGGLVPAFLDDSWRKSFKAAMIPIFMIGIGLAAYNYARFGSMTEFGIRYQMAGADITTTKLLSWRLIPYGFRLYWLLPASWSPYFPFVSAANIPPAPTGQFGVEDPYGILPNIPFVFLGLGALVVARSGSVKTSPALAQFCQSTFLAAAAAATTVTCFGGIANRYMIDFVPAFLLLASIGMFALAAATYPTRLLRISMRLVAILLFVYSAAFNVLASFRHNELFRIEHPNLYKRLVHTWSQIPYSFDRWFHSSGYGDLELKVIFPRDVSGTNEPLVVTGSSFLADYLVVHYEPHNVFSFGFEHSSHGAIFGKPIALQPDVPHVIVVSLGSLFPPPGHPFFDSLSPSKAALIQKRLKVTVDGDVALDSPSNFFDAASWEPSVGRSSTGIAYTLPFSGQILSARRVPPSNPDPGSGAKYKGPVKISLRLPPFLGVRREPLVCSGETGRGDLVYLQYLAPGKISFGFDHWGFEGSISAPVDVDSGAVQTITVDYGGLHAQANDLKEAPGGTPGRLVVVVNGKAAMDVAQPFYRNERQSAAIGDNFIGASTASQQFSGTIVDVTYLGR